MPSPAAALRTLTDRGHTVAEIERALGLSPGYLSKVRHRAVRPSQQLVALLEVLRVHPETLETVRGVTQPKDPAALRKRAPRSAAGTRAVEVLLGLEQALGAARVRWALAGPAGLAAHGAEVPGEPGVDIVVHDDDRHVLRLLRERGHAVGHHSSTLSICQVGGDDPNDAIRVHFPAMPPLSTGHLRPVRLQVGGRSLPVVGGMALALAELLSHRAGAEQRASAAIRAGLATAPSLRRRLDTLNRLPETHSTAVQRVFDRTLARIRLDNLCVR